MAHITTITAYNLTEAAEKVGVSRVTLWRHIRDGKLIAQRRGREVLVTAENLLEYVLQEQGGRGIPGPRA